MKKKRMIWLFVAIILIPLVFYGMANAYAVLFGQRDLYELDDKKKLPEGNDAILVLGAGVRADGTPSAMLEDRLLTAVALWEGKAAESVIVSGDHGKVEYDDIVDPL
ncbi:MAG: SanA protein, partial [Clostridia bacterium]|nr:SanA protein [Clostridia bacterium]